LVRPGSLTQIDRDEFNAEVIQATNQVAIAQTESAAELQPQIIRLAADFTGLQFEDGRASHRRKALAGGWHPWLKADS